MTQSRSQILIVDDERFFREAIRDALRAQSFECVLAENGPDALEAAGDPRVGVVVLDIRLPGMDGLEVLRRLRARRPALRVIVISAHADQEDVLEALRMDACDYLAKPLHDEELVLAVRRAAAGYELEASRALLHNRLLGLETWLEDIAARAAEGEEAGAAQIGARVCEAVSQLTGARKSSLMLLDPDAGMLRVVATNGRHLEPRAMDPVPVGEGPAGLAFARGKPLAIDDVEADERFAGRVPRDRYASRSLAVVPLGGGNGPAGVLCATDREGDAGFGDEELIPLRILALQTAQLLSRRPREAPVETAAQAGREAVDRDAELARLVCDALSREIEPERVIAAALRPVAAALRAAPVSLHLIDNASGELVLEGQVEGDARPDRERLPRDRGLTGAVLQTGNLVASDHPETDPRFELGIDTPADGEVGPLLCVPLRLRGKNLGVLRAFPSENGLAAARTAEVLSAALSAAVRNVLLYRSLLESIEELADVRRQTEGRV